MVRRALPALLLPALLCGCQLFSTGGPGVRTVNAGRALAVPVSVPYDGTWSVKDLPAWASVSRTSGSGPVAFTVTVDRAAGVPAAADRPTLTGTLTVAWTEPRGRTGTTAWPVRADAYALTGQVSPAPVAAAGVTVASLRAAAGGAARGVIVTYRDGSLDAQGGGPAGRTLAGLRAAGVAARRVHAVGPRHVLVDTTDPAAAIRVLRGDPRVQAVTPNTTLRAQATPTVAPVVPTDQYAPLQWPFRVLGYGAVWRDMQDTPYTRPVTVAVVDSGVRYDHPDLAGRVYGPADGALDVLAAVTDGSPNGDGDGPDTDPTDPWVPGRTLGSHGTHVTGIIAARWGRNDTAGCDACSPTGVVGAVAGANVKVLPVRVIDAEGVTDIAQVAVGLRYAAGLPVTLDGVTRVNPHPAQVVNLSLGGPITAEEAAPLCDAVAEAGAAGALVIAAGGNGYGTTPYYPAACEGAVAVGSVTLSAASAPRRATYSNAYAQVQLSAPGGTDYIQDPTTYNGARWDPQGDGTTEPFVDGVISTGWNYARNTPNYEVEVGTSQAAPQVSALAALLLSKGVTTDAAGTLARLRSTATDLGAAGRDPQFGFGMVNAAAALGAPAVSDTAGLRVQDDRGNAVQPPLDAVGRFRAYVGHGTFRVTAGRDRDGNGVPGEATEPRAEASATLGPDRPSADVGVLTPGE